MEEKDSWGLTEEEIKQRLRRQNQENSAGKTKRTAKEDLQGEAVPPGRA